MTDPDAGSGSNSPTVEMVSPCWRAVTAVPCTKLGPGSGGRGLLARANSSLTSEKPRVDRHQPPQSADAIRQEQIEWRVAAAVADIRALIAREEVEHRINVFAWCREDAHRVQVEGATGRPSPARMTAACTPLVISKASPAVRQAQRNAVGVRCARKTGGPNTAALRSGAGQYGVDEEASEDPRRKETVPRDPIRPNRSRGWCAELGKPVGSPEDPDENNELPRDPTRSTEGGFQTWS